MVKFTAKYGDRTLIGFGISDANVAKLREGKPIHIHGEEVGVPNQDFLILWGETEESMREELAALIGEHTEVREGGEGG
jgi:hypothetical protein